MRKLMKKGIGIILTVTLMSTAVSCGYAGAEQGTAAAAGEEALKADDASGGEDQPARPVLLNAASSAGEEIRANVPEWEVDNDFGNVINYDQIYLEDEAAEHLLDDGFCVTEYGGSEFFEIYESNRYNQTPSFITVDSLMHSYHLYFSHLLKKTEKEKLMSALSSLTDRMLSLTEKQKNASWE